MTPYDVKVLWPNDVNDKTTWTFIWGGAGVEIALADSNVLLHFRVDELGEEIIFGLRNDTSSPFKTLGQLKPGESFTLSLKGLRGIFARCVDTNADTRISCTLLFPGAPAQLAVS